MTEPRPLLSLKGLTVNFETARGRSPPSMD
jgi:hypothetical protein